MSLSIPFAEALDQYPEFIRPRVAELGITTTTQLWILGEEMEWSEYRLAGTDHDRRLVDESLALMRANWWLCAHDDLPDLLEELRKRTGVQMNVGDALTWARTEAWARNFGDRRPEGILVERAPLSRYPHMAMPLGIEVGPHQVFPAWTLTRQTGVRLLR